MNVMKYLFCFLIFCVGACKESSIKTQISTQVNFKKDSTRFNNDCIDYITKKKRCSQLLNEFRSYSEVSSTPNLLLYLIDSLMPCWYGTSWDYNGCTTLPGKGSIACGYFVTTVLQDAGIKLNRIKLAQSPSSIIIHRLCNNIKMFCNQPVDNLINAVKQNGQVLYIVGLDFHTGFIYCDGKEVYFIHASYYGPKCVIKEKALSSAVLIHSKYRQLGRVIFK